MNELLILLTLYCGTPVSIGMDIHKDGKHEFMAGAIPPGDTKFWMEQIKILESGGAQVRIVKVEEVMNLKCAVST